MRANLACLSAIAVLLAACGSGGVTPGAERLGTPAIETPRNRRGPRPLPRPGRVRPPRLRRRMPTTAPAATTAPSVAPTPRVTPEPTLPPVTPPWTLDGSIAPDDPDTEDWGWGTSDVLLANGDVLLVNGDGREAAIRDAGSGAWRIVPGLPAVRTGFGFVALGDGSALAVGGVNADGVSFSSVYRFDPVETTWRKIGLLEWARSYPGVALLPDGRVLVAGGSFLNGEVRADASSVVLAAYPEDDPADVELADSDPEMPVTVPYATVEIFDPGTGTSTMARPMACARGEPGVATLADGRIMVTDLVEEGCGAAEIYDPATGSFTKTGELPPLDTKALEREGLDIDGGGEPWLGSPVALGDGGALLGLEEWMKHSHTTLSLLQVPSRHEPLDPVRANGGGREPLHGDGDGNGDDEVVVPETGRTRAARRRSRLHRGRLRPAEGRRGRVVAQRPRDADLRPRPERLAGGRRPPGRDDGVRGAPASRWIGPARGQVRRRLQRAGRSPRSGTTSTRRTERLRTGRSALLGAPGHAPGVREAVRLSPHRPVRSTVAPAGGCLR